MQALDLNGHLIPGTSAAGWRIGTRLADCGALTGGARVVEYQPGFHLVNAINANEGVLIVRDYPRGWGHATAYVGAGVVTFRFNGRGELYEVAVANGYQGRAFDRIGIGSPLDEVRSLFPVFYDAGDEMCYPDGPNSPSGIAFYASATEEPGSTPILAISVHDWDVMRRQGTSVGCSGPAAATLKYPREWLERVPAVVFACLRPGELRIIVHPGVGLADGGAPRDVPVDVIPPDLRMPNTPLWLKLDEQMNILQVWRRNE